MESTKHWKSPTFATLGAALWVIGSGVAIGYLGEGLARQNASIERYNRLIAAGTPVLEAPDELELYARLATFIGGGTAILGALIFAVSALVHAVAERRVAVVACLTASVVAIVIDVSVVASNSSDINAAVTAGESAAAVTAPFYTTALIIALWGAAWIVGRRRRTVVLLIPVVGGLVGSAIMGIGASQADAQLADILAAGEWDGGKIAIPVVIFGLLTVAVSGVGGAWLATLADQKRTPTVPPGQAPRPSNPGQASFPDPDRRGQASV
ncbi:hypothetical protein [Gordonia terrae]